MVGAHGGSGGGGGVALATARRKLAGAERHRQPSDTAPAPRQLHVPPRRGTLPLRDSAALSRARGQGDQAIEQAIQSSNHAIKQPSTQAIKQSSGPCGPPAHQPSQRFNAGGFGSAAVSRHRGFECDGRYGSRATGPNLATAADHEHGAAHPGSGGASARISHARCTACRSLKFSHSSPARRLWVRRLWVRRLWV